MYNVKWVDILYKDIIPGKYEVCNKGYIRNKKTGKLLFGCNPCNEKGYIRLSLQTTTKPKKFPLHRIVANAFIEGYSDDLEVNHKDGNPLNNNVSNLEYVDRIGNARHAAIHGLYSSCESHHKSLFTNKQVIQICELLQKGRSQNYIIKYLGLSDIKHIKTYISRIKERKTWTNISKNYHWDDDILKYKTYPKHDIEEMCRLLFVEGFSPTELINSFPMYEPKKIKQVLKKIKQGKLYKDISKKYINREESSTTIENDDNYYYIDIII